MSTGDIEITNALGEPMELYRFEYGAGALTVFTYTDGDFAVTSGGEEYRPIPIEREALNASGTLDKSALEVSVPENSALADVFRVSPPANVMRLTIWQCHWDPDERAITTPLAIWAGRVLSCGRAGHWATFECEPITSSLRRVGLRRHWQYMCPHVLYGDRCRATSGDHTVGATAQSVDRRSVTVSGEAGNQWNGGMIEFTPTGEPTTRLTITRVQYDSDSGSTRFELAGVLRGLAAGDEFNLVRGCSHTLDECRDVFDNAPNFGGMPWIPRDNPHGSTRIYH